MDDQRRRFLKTSAAGAAVSAVAGATTVALEAVAQRTRAEWSTPLAALGERVRLDVWRGEAPQGAVARLRFLIHDGATEREVEQWEVPLQDDRQAFGYELPYPFDELQDVSLRYTLALSVSGGPEVRSAPLQVDVLRFRFSC